MRARHLAGTLIGLSMAVACTVTPLASAEPAAPYGNFYTPPSPLPAGKPGDLIRTEPSHIALSVPGNGGSLPANATRIMYRSQDTHGAPVAVTGTYFDPTLPWKGPGPRPVVSLAPGTQGQGDQCAPSKVVNTVISYTPPLDVALEYELLSADTLLAQGVAVVMTDYEGLGTPGMHTYVNRLAEAHAVLDAARAAQRLPGTQIPANGPVGMWGYSQGGGAAAAAAELASSYAPDLHVKGTYAGAPVADLQSTLEMADGGLGTGFIGYGVNSLYASYPQIRPVIDQNINARGREMLARVANQCAGETIFTYGLQKTSAFTNNGQPIASILKTSPIAQKVVQENRVGSLVPKAPVLMISNISDDLVPHAQVQQLADDWRAKGADVALSTVNLPPILPGSLVGHGLLIATGVPEASSWMVSHFDGK